MSTAVIITLIICVTLFSMYTVSSICYLIKDLKGIKPEEIVEDEEDYE